MAILVDWSGVAISSVMISSKQMGELDENYIRHVILNIIRSARTKNVNQYGEVVICCDSPNSWRKKLFPYYKANRKKQRDDSFIDWSELLRIIEMVRDEVEQNFPYKVIRVPHTEADDIIAAISLWRPEKHLIVSNDKDFFQLQIRENVDIYSPNRSMKVKCPNPDEYLLEHIIKGDQGDGVPNMFSDDDTFVNPAKRQKVIRKEKLAVWIKQDPKEAFTEEQMEGYERNRKLISLFDIPSDIVDEILEAYINSEAKGKRGSTMMNYFIKKRLTNLMDSINQF